jgi:hypothetical protein
MLFSESMRHAMGPRFARICCFAVAASLLAIAPARAFEPGDDQYPNSIIAPEPGSHHHVTASGQTRHGRTTPAVKALAKQSLYKNLYAVRGSSGSVLPTPLPRTQLIPPEGGGMPTPRASPQEQGATVLPGMAPVPNLSHGAETFQDRASRCAFQQGLNNVPAAASSQYMHACAM